jgi:hypothetical protein
MHARTSSTEHKGTITHVGHAWARVVHFHRSFVAHQPISPQSKKSKTYIFCVHMIDSSDSSLTSSCDSISSSDGSDSSDDFFLEISNVCQFFSGHHQRMGINVQGLVDSHLRFLMWEFLAVIEAVIIKCFKGLKLRPGLRISLQCFLLLVIMHMFALSIC